MLWFSFTFQFIAIAISSWFALFCKNRPRDQWDYTVRGCIQLGYLFLIVPIVGFCNETQEDIDDNICRTTDPTSHIATQICLLVSFVLFQCIFYAYYVSDTAEFRKSSIMPGGVLTISGLMVLICSYVSSAAFYTQCVDDTKGGNHLALVLGSIQMILSIGPIAVFVCANTDVEQFDKWSQSYIVHHWKDLNTALIAVWILAIVLNLVNPQIWNVIFNFAIVSGLTTLVCRNQYKRYHEVVVDETSAKSD